MTGHQVRSYGPNVTETHRTPTSAPGPSGAQNTPVPRYEIRVDGRLPARWSAWFDGLSVVTDDDGTTTICGPVADQAALHGLIQKLRDVGIPLVSLTQVVPDAPAQQPDLNKHQPSHNPSGATP